MPTGAHNPHVDDEPRGEAGTPLAPPPVETPGPSVPPPALPESETERAEWADQGRSEEELAARDDATMLAEEEAAAAAEAGAIGGAAPASAEDPAMEPVYQAGGGEQEGFEQAEADLVENATHGEGRGDPLRDALTPELESDLSGAEYGGSDDIPSTQVTRDPDEGPDDPGAGPTLGADRAS